MAELYDDEGFDEGLEELFTDENFYANPMRTKIYFNLTGIDSDEEIVGNAVVANIEETNEKIPVYSYNSSTYQKYLQGKRIITGVIALRKVTVASFLKLLKKERTEQEYEKDKTEILNQINELNKITDENNLKPTELINMLHNKLNEIELKKQKSNKYDEFYIKDINEILEKDNLLYYIENAGKNNEIGGNKASIRLEFKNSYDNGPKIKIQDVLFVKKQTEINIDKTDVFEVYSFIGNPAL